MKLFFYLNLGLTIIILFVFVFDRMNIIQYFSENKIDTVKFRKYVNEQPVAFFYMDTVELKSDYIKKVKMSISKIIAKYEVELNNLGKLYLSYQKNLKKNKKSKKIKKEIKIIEEKYQLLKIAQKQKIEHLYSQYDIITKKNLREILNAYRKKRGIQFVYSYEEGFMYSVDSEFNITNDIVLLFNEDFKENPHKYLFFN